MSIRLPLALAASCVLATASFAQPERVAWLRSNAIALDDSSSDASLARIGRALNGVDVVFLGESSHGDGGAHLARVRLVRYLHERLGFDLIAWEAGTREAVAFDSLLGTSAPLGSITATALYPWWALSAELRPVLEYIRGTRRSTRPLTFAGFDIQRSGSIEALVSDLRRAFAQSGNVELFPRSLDDSLSFQLQRLTAVTGASRDSVANSIERMIHAAMPDLRRRFESARSTFTQRVGVRETAFVSRVLLNLSSNAEQVAASGVASYNIRERRNAENILWLLRERYPKRKIIVWSHNVHAINTRFTQRFDGVAATAAENARDATARIVHDSLGRRAYSLIVASYDGAWAFPNGQRTELPAAAAGSLVTLLHDTGLSRAFLDLRGTHPAWLDEPLVGTLNTQSPARYAIVWPRATDGILFVDRMTPSSVAPD
jgi:erythromycin esterase